MVKQRSLPWKPPLDFAKDFQHYDHLALLHSSLQHPEHGQYSILALKLNQAYENDVNALNHAITATNQTHWLTHHYGYFGYEAFTEINASSPSPINFPKSWFGQFATVFVFDHQHQTLTHYGDEAQPQTAKQREAATSEITTLASNMTKAEYLTNIEQTLEQIAAGEFYQANITRKFFGEFSRTPNAFALFERLCKTSPACYAAYLKIDGQHILSSSPECFLTFRANGSVESRPIKGTAPRDTNPQDLANSIKDRAENLMIVDLMRNDLSQHCQAGTIKTHKLFEVTSYETLHHMASTVIGQRKTGSKILQLIESCYPAGSMTGAPKKAVMQWCAEKEQSPRGVYSGALGWLSRETADLSVIIRTLLIDGKHFEFQVGGGIVADSQPEKEWQETLTKSKGIANAIGLDLQRLAEL